MWVWGGGSEWIEQLSPRGQWQSIDWCQNHSRWHVILNSNVCLQPPGWSWSPYPLPPSSVSLPPARTTLKQILMKKILAPPLLGSNVSLAVSSSEHWKGRLGQGIYEETHKVWCLEACVIEKKQNKLINKHRCIVQPGSQAQYFVLAFGQNVENLLIGTCKIEICVFLGPGVPMCTWGQAWRNVVNLSFWKLFFVAIHRCFIFFSIFYCSIFFFCNVVLASTV